MNFTFPEVGAGLKNLGNTCFLNAVIQCLVHNPDFHKCLFMHQECSSTEFCGVCCLKAIALQKTGTICPTVIHGKLNRILPHWDHNQQEDAHEFLVQFLEYVKETSFRSLTNIGIKTTVRCINCNGLKVQSNYQSHLQAELQGINLEQLMNTTEEEILTADNLVFCNSCQGNTKAGIKREIFDMPSTLIIHIRRFFWENMSPKKNCQELSFKEKMMVSDKKGNQNEYVLSSVLVHLGNRSEDGHYVSYVCTLNGWYEMDDTKVTMIDIGEVLKKQAYVLFYNKTTPIKSDSSTLTEASQTKHPQTSQSKKKLSLSSKRHDDSKHVHYKYNTKDLPTRNDMEECFKMMSLKTLVASIVWDCNRQHNKQVIDITGIDLLCLKQRNDVTNDHQCWLKDNIVNSYIVLICNSITNNSILPINSFFMSKLSEKGIDYIIEKWYRKLKMFDGFNMWIIPVHKGSHWAMMVVDFQEKVIHYSDSMYVCGVETSATEAITKFIDRRYTYETKNVFSWTNWRQDFHPHTPQQKNPFDCGVFAIKAAQYIAHRKQTDYSQRDIPRFRNEIIYEILHGRLLVNSNDRLNVHQNGALSYVIEKEQIHKKQSPFPKKALNSTSLQSSNGISSYSVLPSITLSVTSNVKSIIKTEPKSRIDTINETKITPTDDKSLPTNTSPTSLPSLKDQHSTDKLTCSYCGRMYAHKSSLSKHVHKEHGESQGGHVICSICGRRVVTLEKLINHLHHDHQIEVEVSDVILEGAEKFMEWKEDLERQTHSSFILKCAPVMKQDYKIWYYYCNRAGTYKPEGCGKRQVKSQGSAKTGFQCSAFIKASQYLNNQQVYVKYCSTHYNHQSRLAFLKLPPKIRLDIGRKLELGVDMQRILDDIRDTCEGGINREHLVNRQDIRNIKFQYNIEGVIRHSNDLNSVTAWANEMQSLDYNPILLFKQQGLSQPEDCNNFSDGDFILCIQTQFQRDMLIKFGNDTICMDATHGTNIYDFQLITMLVVDEYGEGLPVGWMISNREDAIALNAFLTHVKVVCGNIEPLWFMSDDAEQYFNAWRGVFSSMKTRKLLCVWHIHRAWCKALREHVGSKDDQIGIYHTLCVLLQEHDESKMRMSLQAFLTDLYSNQERFYLYFNSTYCSRVQEWATCYRKGCTANTNMFIESFHRVLKVVYLHHKQNRRVDFLLVMLMKISRNNTFERFRKLEIGKQTHRICEIARRHKSALSLSSNCISTVTKEKWKVTSQTIQNKDYTIERVLEACDCKILCRDCNICPHIYTCTCLDATLHATVCKHVHLVCIQNGNSNKTIMMQTNDYTYFNDVLFQNLTETTDLNAAKQKLLSCLKELENEVKVCNEIDSIHTARKHVQAAVSIIKAMQNQKESVLPLKRKVSPNENHEKQRRFFSTKKKTVTATPSISKPSLQQSDQCKTKIRKTDPMFCGNCLKENDINHGNQTIQWIQCDTCFMWLHLSCTRPKLTSVPENYSCHFCCH